MSARALAGTILVLALLAGPASATGIHGRGPRAEAAIDSTLPFGDRAQRVQVLTQLCANPQRIARCSAMPRQLRRALERAIEQPITWVDARRVRGPVFWVFAPVAFDRHAASGAMAWWDPGNACRGGTEQGFSLQQGSWRLTQGTAWEGCPAT